MRLVVLSDTRGQLQGEDADRETSLQLTRAVDVHDLPGYLAAESRVHLFASITYYDPAEQIMFVLTDLPNRRLCEARLGSSIAEATKDHISLALLYVDVDRFKYVNDKYGHKIGDLYLKEISRRLQRQVRAHDTLARIGGDEFMAMTLHDSKLDTDFAGTLAQRFASCFESPFALDGNIIYGSASIGMARYPMDGTNAEELKRAADQNMYRDKKLGTAGSSTLREVS